MLSKAIRQYLLKTDNGRLILGNAVALVRMGMASANELVDLFDTAHSLAQSRKSGPIQAEDFEYALNTICFPNGVATRPPQAWPVKKPKWNTPDLTDSLVYTVIPLRFFNNIVPLDAPLRDFVELPTDGREPEDSEGFEQSWREIPETRLEFAALGDQLGRPLIWITDELSVRRARAMPLKGRRTIADSFVRLLGLGHYETGRWAILLTLPGGALQRAGHHRPTFADAGAHRFFMMRGACPWTPANDWGQTADLNLIGERQCDGVPERVAWSLAPGPLENGETIRVELLGKVTANLFATDAAPRMLANDVWARRR